MSLFDYQISKEIAAKNYPFYALIMAAMRQADTDNIEKLKMIFPDIFRELKARYNASGGLLTKDEESPGKVKLDSAEDL